MRQRIGSKLKQTRDQLTPDRSWVSSNREVLMRSVHTDMAEVVSTKTDVSMFQGFVQQLMPAQFATVARSAMALLLAITVTTGGWIATVAASAESLPGEKLHTIKLATEGVELAVSRVLGSDEDEVATQLKHASNRAKEYQKSPKPEQKQQAIQALKKTIESSNETLDEIEPKKAVAVAKVVGEKTEEILTELNNAKKEQKELEPVTEKNTLPDNVDTLDAEVAEVEELIEQASVKAITVLLEESTKEESEVSQEEVKNVVEKKVARLTSELTEINEELKDTVEQASATGENDGVEEFVKTVDAVLSSVSSTSSTVLDGSAVTITTSTTSSSAAVSTTSSSMSMPMQTSTGTLRTTTGSSTAVIADIELLIEQKDVVGILDLFESLTQQKKQALYSVAEIKEALNVLLEIESEAQKVVEEFTEDDVPAEKDIQEETVDPAAEEPNTQP